MTSSFNLNAPVGTPGYLSSIAAEIILWIGGYLGLYDLYSLIRTARRFYSLLSPRFYKLALSHEKDQNNPLIWAVRKGYMTVVQKLLAQENDAHAYRTRLILGTSSLHEAVTYKNDDALRLLLQHRPFKSLYNSCGESPLMVAARNNNTTAVSILLDAGAGIDDRPGQEWAVAAHKAVSESSEDALLLLLDNKVRKGWVPQGSIHNDLLEIAARKGNASTIRSLYDRGWDIRSGSAFHPACYSGNLDTVKLFLELGTDVNVRDAAGCTALHGWAIGEDIEMVRYLVEHGADVNAVGEDNLTPLHVAIGEGAFAVAQYLLSAGADVTAEDEDGQTPLRRLVSEQADVVFLQDMITALVEAGADINEGPRTPLHLAAEQGQLTVVDLLLKLGADVNLRDEDGCIPLHDALSRDDTTCIADIVERLLNAGSDVLSEDNKLHTPLLYAASSGLVDVFQKLLAICKANNMDYLKRCECGQSVFEEAAVYGKTAIIEAALDQPEDLNQIPDGKPHWMPALHQAVAIGQTETAEWLLTHGANPYILDRYGRSALDWASLDEQMSAMVTKHCPEAQTTNHHKRKFILRESVNLLAARLLENLEYAEGFYQLGKCLIFLDDLGSARAAFSQFQVSCDLCKDELPPADGRFVCLSCLEVDICEACMDEYRAENRRVKICEGHEFIEIQSSDGDVLEGDEATNSWLEDLMTKYAVSEQDPEGGSDCS